MSLFELWGYRVSACEAGGAVATIAAATPGLYMRHRRWVQSPEASRDRLFRAFTVSDRQIWGCRRFTEASRLVIRAEGSLNLNPIG